MSRSTISTFQLFKLFPDAETARKYLESRLWKVDRMKLPKELEKLVDKVLSYKPKKRKKRARKRKRKG